MQFCKGVLDLGFFLCLYQTSQFFNSECVSNKLSIIIFNLANQIMVKTGQYWAFLLKTKIKIRTTHKMLHEKVKYWLLFRFLMNFAPLINIFKLHKFVLKKCRFYRFSLAKFEVMLVPHVRLRRAVSGTMRNTWLKYDFKIDIAESCPIKNCPREMRSLC